MDKQHPESPSPEHRGLICRQCGGTDFRVLYTRGASGGRLVRRRQCRYCHRRYTTVERILK
jgi:transcriptional regulator NrdR family protein